MPDPSSAPSEKDPLAGLPPDLASILRDQSIVVPQDAAVFEQIAKWANAPSNTASATPVSPSEPTGPYPNLEDAEHERLEGERDDLVRRIRQYTRHSQGCSILARTNGVGYTGVCDCGLVEVLAALGSVPGSSAADVDGAEHVLGHHESVGERQGGQPGAERIETLSAALRQARSRLAAYAAFRDDCFTESVRKGISEIDAALADGGQA